MSRSRLLLLLLSGVSLGWGGGPERVPVLEAYKRGKVKLVVEVVPGEPAGSKVRLSVENKGKEPLKLVVPKGTTVFPGHRPLPSFTIEVTGEKHLDVDADGASAFEAAQKGEERALKGRFTLSVSAGKPLFSGTAEVGPAPPP
jgi:hypothetical protein